MTRPSLRLPLSPEDRDLLEALLRETFEPHAHPGDEPALAPSREARP